MAVIQKKLIEFVGSSSIYAAGIGIQLVTVVLLARALGPADFGRYSVYTAICLILVELIALGSGDMMIKASALDARKFNRYFGNSLALGGMCLVPAALALVFFGWFYELVSIPLLLAPVALAELFFGRIAVLGEQAHIAHGRASAANFLRLLCNALRMAPALIFFLTKGNYGLMAWLSIQSIATATAGALTYVLIRKHYGKPAGGVLRGEFVPGLPFSATQVIRMTQLQVDRLLIGVVASAGVTGVYAAASRVVGLGTVPMVTLLRMTYAQFFIKGKNGIRAAFPFGLRVLGMLLGVAIPTAIAFFFLAPYLPFLLGKDYANAVETAKLLAPITIIMAFQYAGGDLLSGSNHQTLRLVSTAANLIFIASSILIIGNSGTPNALVVAVLGGNLLGAVLTWLFVGWMYLVDPGPAVRSEDTTR